MHWIILDLPFIVPFKWELGYLSPRVFIQILAKVVAQKKSIKSEHEFEQQTNPTGLK